MKKKRDFITPVTIFLLIVISLAGILSLNFSYSYEVKNQYGDVVQMFGYGIYAHDTYFKAPISIGSDIGIFLVLVPLFIFTYIRNIKENHTVSKLKLISVYAVALYYAVSIAFGNAYNMLHLAYIALVTCSLFGMFYYIRQLNMNQLNLNATKGMKIFLIIAGIVLIVAWLPDIIPTLFTGKSLALIGIYTTEITYVLDMGIMAPLCMVCVYLLNKKDNLGTLIFAILLKICIIIGMMIFSQTGCQIASGTDIGLPVLLTKAASFVILGGFAYYFNHQLYKQLREGI